MVCCHVEEFIHSGDENLEKAMVNGRKHLHAEKLKKRASSILIFGLMEAGATFYIRLNVLQI